MAAKKQKTNLKDVKGTQYPFAGTPFNGTSTKVYMLIHNVPRLNLSGLGEVGGYNKVILLGTLKALSISTFRDKTQVRALGFVNPKGFVRGNRTIAGTMVFQELNIATINRLRNTYGKMRSDGTSANKWEKFPFMLDDQLPRFDLFISIHTELRDAAHGMLHRVEFFSNGQSISINGLAVDEVVKYQAEAYEPIDFDGKNFNKDNTKNNATERNEVTAFRMFAQETTTYSDGAGRMVKDYMRKIQNRNPFF